MAPERKYIDVFSDRSSGSSVFLPQETLIPLSFIAEGNGANQRIGTKVNIESYNVHMNMRFPDEPARNVDSGTFNNFFRYGVVYDRQPNSGSIPSIAGDIFTSFWGHVNKDNRDRFFIISDKFAVLGDFANFQQYIVDPGPPPVFR
jgi:Geminivirus coat protein/nuclear export factor BR1 family.